MLSSQAILAHFKPLDGLIRVIEQKDKHDNLVQFVVLSAVDDLNWTVHVGWIDVRNQSGRWWHGRWSENEIRAKVGTDVRDLVLGVFVRNLVSAFVEGDMRVEDWSRKKGADISMIIGMSMEGGIACIPIVERPPEDAAAHAMKVFQQIAEQAQQRACRLYPPADDPAAHVSTSTPTKKSDDNHDSALSSRDSSPCDWPDEDYRAKQMRYQPPRKLPKTDGREKDRRISDEEMFDIDENEDAPNLDRTAAHRGKLEEAKLRSSTTRSSPAHPGSSAHPRTPKAGSARQLPPATVPRLPGASLANPTKKARKFVPIEFESD